MKTKLKIFETALLLLIAAFCLFSSYNFLQNFWSIRDSNNTGYQRDSATKATNTINKLVKSIAKKPPYTSSRTKEYDRKSIKDAEQWMKHVYMTRKSHWTIKHLNNQVFMREYTFLSEKDGKYLFQEKDHEMPELNIHNITNDSIFFILDNDGKILFHTDENIINSNIYENTWINNEEGLFKIAVEALANKDREITKLTFFDRRRGQDRRLFYRYIPDQQWCIGITLPTKKTLINSHLLRQLLIKSLSFMTISILILIFFISTIGKKSKHKLVIVNTFYSLFLILAITLTWTIYRYFPDNPVNNPVLWNQQNVEDSLNEYEDYLESFKHEKALKVKTGVFVQSVEFLSGTNIKMTGIIWQNYTEAQRQSIGDNNIGIILPEADEMNLTEVYKIDRRTTKREHNSATLPDKVLKDNETSLIIGWAFICSLRQEFDYRIYPFDRQSTWLRIRHKKMKQNIVLTPDFSSYQQINPNLKPGVDSDLILPGWSVENSFYNYRKLSQNTNFGISTYAAQKNFPELFFNVNFRRDFLGPLVTEFIPILVASILLFALLLISSRKEKGGLFGFSAIDVILGCAALFFVLVFQHIALRNRFGAQTVIYMEYFYFLLYVLMILIIINSLIFASEKKVRWIHKHDNLYPKITFWPLISCFLYTVTFIYFY